MGILWRKSGLIERDDNDIRAAGAQVYFFEGGTTTPRPTYSDAALTTARAHPVVADANGRWPAIFMDFGSYDEQVITTGGTQLSYYLNIPNPEPTDPTDTVDEDALLTTGDMWPSFKSGTRPGSVRANGRTIGNASSTGTERANADAEPLYVYLYNALADTQAPVSGGRGASAAADFAAAKTLALPDLRGAILVGLDDMGSSAASLLGSAPFTNGNATTAASVLGANTHTISASETPAHTHSFSATSGAGGSHLHTVSITTDSQGSHTHTGTTDSDGAHTHTIALDDASGNQAMAAASAGAQDNSQTTSSNGAHTHAFTTASNGAHTHSVSGNTGAEASHTHSVSGTSGSTGGGSAHNNVQRGVLCTWYIKL